MTAKRTHLVVVLLALTAAGCQDPYSRPKRPSAAAVTTTPVTSRDAGGAGGTARIFASRWINWDWRTAGAQQRALALMAGGSVAVDLRANAGSARIDASLARDKPGSRGDVVATDLSRRAASATGIVVTREQTYTAGHADLGGRHYRVYRVRLTLTNGRWEVSSWERLP
jgi:hypothetical protein